MISSKHTNFLNKLANYYHQRAKSEVAQQFFNRRKISKEMVDKFLIGYAGSGNEDLEMLTGFSGGAWVNREDYKTSVELGMISFRDTEDGRIQFPYFRSRIMFPYRDLQGNVVGFTGRDLTNKSKQKYLNSRESEVFNKNILLYGMYECQDRIFNNRPDIFIVEGNIDVIRMYDKGYAVVGLSTTSMSEWQISILASIFAKTYLMLDGDEAGRKGASRITWQFTQFNKSKRKVRIPRYISLPDGKDPDTFLLSGAGAQEYINEQVYLNKFAPTIEFTRYIPKKQNPEYFKETFDVRELKSRVNIIDVIGSRIELRRSGISYMARCPFHEENTASFMVSEQKQIFKCFGCGESGDVIKFIMLYDRANFKQAIEIIKDGGK